MTTLCTYKFLRLVPSFRSSLHKSWLSRANPGENAMVQSYQRWPWYFNLRNLDLRMKKKASLLFYFRMAALHVGRYLTACRSRRVKTVSVSESIGAFTRSIPVLGIIRSLLYNMERYYVTKPLHTRNDMRLAICGTVQTSRAFTRAETPARHRGIAPSPDLEPRVRVKTASTPRY